MVQLAERQDLDRLLELYAGARDYMRRSGNPTQWGEDYPSREILEQDLGRGELYVIRRGARICGAFVLAQGEDPTYARIEGEWLRQGPYGTIHRLAGLEGERGIFAECLEFCRRSCPDLRADTHRDNLKMQGLLEHNGFQRCGTIYVLDGSPRIAYQLEGI